MEDVYEINVRGKTFKQTITKYERKDINFKIKNFKFVSLTKKERKPFLELVNVAFKMPLVDELFKGSFSIYLIAWKKEIQKLIETTIDQEEYEDKLASMVVELIGNLLLLVNFSDGLAFDLLKAWQKYQDLLFFAKKTYREHFIHQFYVFLFGCLFLDNLFWKTHENPKIKNRLAETKEPPDVDEKRFFRRWLFAAIFHDIGYPAETLSDLRNALNYEYFNKIPNVYIPEFNIEMDTKDESLEKMIHKMSRIHLFSEYIDVHTNEEEPGKIGINYFEASQKELFNLFMDEIKTTRDHGVAGSVFFLKTALIDVREIALHPDTKSIANTEVMINDIVDDLYIASAAIAGHNLRAYTYSSYTVDFGSRPIASLLMLCDDLHEWDRKPSDPFWSKKSIKLKSIEWNEENLIIKLEDQNKTMNDYFRNSYKNLLNTLKHTFEVNLSDEMNVFFKKIQLKDLFCGRNFIANLEVDASHRKGRYKIGGKVELKIDNKSCVYCSFVNKDSCKLTKSKK